MLHRCEGNMRPFLFADKSSIMSATGVEVYAPPRASTLALAPRFGRDVPQICVGTHVTSKWQHNWPTAVLEDWYCFADTAAWDFPILSVLHLAHIE